MSDTVIKVENLSKLYRLGEVGTRLRYTTDGQAGTLSHCLPRIGGDLNRFYARLRGREDPFAKIGHINPAKHRDTQKAEKGEYVWALKDINFKVLKATNSCIIVVKRSKNSITIN